MNRSASASAERALPCLNSNNCIETANSGEIKQLPSRYENRKQNLCQVCKPTAKERQKAESDNRRTHAETGCNCLLSDKDRAGLR